MMLELGVVGCWPPEVGNFCFHCSWGQIYYESPCLVDQCFNKSRQCHAVDSFTAASFVIAAPTNFSTDLPKATNSIYPILSSRISCMQHLKHLDLIVDRQRSIFDKHKEVVYSLLVQKWKYRTLSRKKRKKHFYNKEALL